MAEGRTVILVPRRDGYPDRDRLWDFCRAWWLENFPDLPLVEGHHDEGLFNRSAAINRASDSAGDWDVAIVIDSDVLTDPAQVRSAIPLAFQSGQMVVPFTVRYNLSPTGTAKILNGYRGSWKPFVARTFRDQHSAVIVIPRTLYDDIGGFDEGFRGWGMEDSAFAIACEMFAGQPLVRMEGELWHLHHATNRGEKHGTPSHRRNMARLELYRVAAVESDRQAINELVQEGKTSASPTDSIPKILHRVVPQETTEQAEAWWLEWQRLHPGWRFMTHRDPLDPDDWPMTSYVWPYVQAGAQLADLIRLEALLLWGGVYVDQDVEPYRPLDPLLGVEMFAAWEDPGSVPNAVVGARPGHPAVSRCLNLCAQRVRRKAGIWKAGPGVFTEVLPGRSDVLLLPPGSFYPYHYTEKERADADHRKEQPWAFGAHHWWHSWAGKG